MTTDQKTITGEIARFIGTGAYTGYSPVASGTVGTVPAVLLAPAMAMLENSGLALYLVTMAAIVAMAIWAAEICSRMFQVKDSGLIVIDEVAGYFFTIAFLPQTWGLWIAAFFVFRFFDIVKPPPARQAESLPGGIGVVTDDLIAGVFGNVTLHAFLWFFPGFFG